MANIVVVGASGPIGRAVANELAAQGNNVTRLSRSGGKSSEQFDVTSSRQTQIVLAREQPDAAVFLARPDINDSSTVADYVTSGVNTLRNFAMQCQEHNVRRLVFASSAAVYGTDNESPRRETDAVHTDSAYAELKLDSERAIHEIAAASTLSVISLRLFNVFGPGLSTSLVNRLAMTDGPKPLVFDTHQFVRDYVHVSDVARAFVFAAVNADSSPSVINVGTGIGTSNRSLLRLFPQSNYTTVPPVEGKSISVADISRARAQLAFEPTVGLSTAIAQSGLFLDL